MNGTTVKTEWWMRFEVGANATATIAEHEWLTTTTHREIFYVPNPPFRTEFLLYHLRQQLNVHKTKWGKRKLRLFACGCCRRFWKQLSPACRAAVEFAEQFADARVTKRERWEYWRRIVNPPNGRSFDLADFGQYVLETSDWVAAIYMPSLSYSVFCKTPRFPHEWGDEAFQMAGIVHDVFGNPFCSVSWKEPWRTSRVKALAETIYNNHRFGDLPSLGDCLEDAGCEHREILAHCRSGQSHVRGCWVVDAIMDERPREPA
jgi:hypothetical protein